MKLNFLIASLAITAMISCSHESKKEGQNPEEETGYSSTTPEKDSGVYFVNIKDGEKVYSPLIVQMGVKGMEVEPAGKMEEGKGHHHIIIDDSYIEKGQMVPKDETHLHYGNGQTSDTITLSHGKHTLTLQFANGVHESYGKDWSKTITVDVEN